MGKQMFWPQNCCMALISSPLIAITGFGRTCCSKHNVPGEDERRGVRGSQTERLRQAELGARRKGGVQKKINKNNSGLKFLHETQSVNRQRENFHPVPLSVQGGHNEQM